MGFYLLIINIITFVIFYYDKVAAQKGEWRVSEKRLLKLALIGGSPAAFLAQYLLRHKNRKGDFNFMLWLITAFQLIIAFWWFVIR